MRSASAAWLCAAAIFVAAVALQCARLGATRFLVAGDAAWYFSSAHALSTRADLDLAPEYGYFSRAVSARSGRRRIVEAVEPDPQTGKVSNDFPIGTGLTLAPFVALAHAVSGSAEPSRLEQLSAAMASAAFGACGLVLAWLLGLLFFSSRLSLLAALTLWLGTPVIYYMGVEPLMSHSLSVFLASLFVLLWWRAERGASLGRWAVLGAVGGWLAIVRYQDALWMALPLIAAVIRAGDGEHPSRLPAPRRLATFALGVLPLCAVQLAVNRVLRGSILSTGYGGSFDWLHPHLVETIFSPVHGFLVFAPVAALSAVGLAKLPRRISVPLALVLLAQLEVVASWSGYVQGASFGCRMLLSATPALALGLGAFFAALERRGVPFKWISIISAALIAANLALATLYCLRVIHDPYIVRREPRAQNPEFSSSFLVFSSSSAASFMRM